MWTKIEGVVLSIMILFSIVAPLGLAILTIGDCQSLAIKNNRLISMMKIGGQIPKDAKKDRVEETTEWIKYRIADTWVTVKRDTIVSIWSR
jgi:hypothetical protein